LRQDPDIVMVGEIRDTETASIAFEAAQTGHLVLSTLHTNDAPSAVTRLLDLGIEPFLVSASLVTVVGQRLVRKICRDCMVPEPLTAEFLKRLPVQGKGRENAKFWKGAGCKACDYTGYSGRLALFEVLKITPSLKKMIALNKSNAELKATAQKEGFQTLSMDGVNKALQGLTTIEEVFRVAPPEVEDVSHGALIEPSMDGEICLEEPMPAVPTAALATVKPQKILLADDSEIILKILQNILESENYSTLNAKNGVEALKLAVQEKPDLIITDYLMPEMDGLTLVRELKSKLNTRYIPVIMLTAKDDVDSEVMGIDAGADDYLNKPVNARKLLARVNRLLRRPHAFNVKEAEAQDEMCVSPG
jgi:type IV pilus assembly protein PilB